MSINVTVVGSTGVTTSIANGDNVVVAVGGTLANTPLTALQVTAGANITVTTTSGVFTIIGRDVPVQSVNGQTGTVLLTSTDVSAASAVHTHVASEITNLTSVANVISVNGQTGVAVLNSTNVSAASAVHTHVMADVTDLAFPVSSVNGYTGTVSLTITDLTAASASHTHAASEVTDLTSVANVVSVNGYTGVVALTIGDITAASATHTHSMAEVADITFPVNSVNGQTGTVSLTSVEVSAASAVHMHVASDITDFTSVANVISVNGLTGVVTVTGGVTAASVTTKALTVDENDYDAGSSDIVRLTPSANVTLTGLAGGSDGVVRVLYNIGTHIVTLATGNTNSAETNRFSIVSGNVTLDEGDSASAWYDGTSQRWRVLEDQSSDGSGGGIAMSYLFG